MYMLPRFSLSVASTMSRWAWPSGLKGRQGMLFTPSSVPVKRPAPRAEPQCLHLNTNKHPGSDHKLSEEEPLSQPCKSTAMYQERQHCEQVKDRVLKGKRESTSHHMHVGQCTMLSDNNAHANATLCSHNRSPCTLGMSAHIIQTIDPERDQATINPSWLEE